MPSFRRAVSLGFFVVGVLFIEALVITRPSRPVALSALATVIIAAIWWCPALQRAGLA